MSSVRSASVKMALASMRASSAPIHWWTPCPNDVCLGPVRVISKVSAFSNAASSRLADPVSRNTPSPVLHRPPPHDHVRFCDPEVRLHRAIEAQHLVDRIARPVWLFAQALHLFSIAHEAVSRKRVVRLMRLKGLRARARKRFQSATMSEHDQPVAANVLDRDFVADAPNQRWAACNEAANRRRLSRRLVCRRAT